MEYKLKGSVTAIKIGAEDKDLEDFLKAEESYESDDEVITILQGDHEIVVRRGYYLLRDKDGEFSVLKPKEFEARYEAEVLATGQAPGQQLGQSQTPPAPSAPVAEGENQPVK